MRPGLKKEKRMDKAIPRESDAVGFEANLDGCSEPLREVVAYLRSSAKYAGAHVTTRRHKHPKPNAGWGIKYYRGGKPFCEFNPKRAAAQVWGFIHGADPVALEA